MQYLQGPLDSDNPEILRLINNITIFAGIGVTEQRLVARKSKILYFGPEHMIFDEGDIGDCLYVIINGEVQVAKRSLSLGWIPVAKLGRGDYFGEVAILRNVPRTARVTTITTCQVLSLSRIDFLNTYQNFPQKSRDNIQMTMSKRLEELRML